MPPTQPGQSEPIRASRHAREHARREEESQQHLPHLAPVPEPATLMLFGSALVGLGVFGRRHRKNIAA